MGQSIGWYRLKEHPKYGHESIWADDVPDMFDMKFDGRWEWYQAIWDVPYERVPVTDYDCHYMRPTDFAAFRQRLTELGLLADDEEHEIFREMTDWLEQHSDVYVEYS